MLVDGAPNSLTVHHVGDIADFDESQIQQVELKCIIINRNKNSKFLFLEVQDETGTTQVAFYKHDFSESDWTKLVGYRSGDTLSITGEVTDRFPSARIIGKRLDEVEDDQLFVGRQHIGMGSAVSFAYLARLKQHLRDKLVLDGFIEVDTRLISSRPPVFPGLYPLKVHYDGFGAHFHIMPTPVSQLVFTLSSTSYPKVFSAGRCFTQGYRDPVVSVESLILSIAERKTKLIDMLRSADRHVRSILSAAAFNLKEPANMGDTIVVRTNELGPDRPAAVSIPQIQPFTVPENEQGVTLAARLCWPYQDDGPAEFREFVVAEGFSTGPAVEPAYSVVTINVDRLLALLFEFTDIRRIPDLHFGGNDG